MKTNYTAFVNKAKKTKGPIELKDLLREYFPSAFINFDAAVFKVGDKLKRIVGGRVEKYLIVKTHNNKAAMLNINNSTLWKNISNYPVMPFGNISRECFLEISNGVSPEKFKKVKR